jgi:hypothetical protein
MEGSLERIRFSRGRQRQGQDLYRPNGTGFHVAVVKWSEDDEIAEAIHHELKRLGYQPTYFLAGSAIPDNQGVVFSFAPYGKFLPLVRQLERLPAKEQPLLVHWNTEGVPDLRIPWILTRSIGAGRSWLDRTKYDLERRLWHGNGNHSLLSPLDSRMLRFRYVGDYYYAFRKGVLNVLSDSSAIYSQLHSCRGLPTLFAPWGSSPQWYADLQLERDIDVLWMGNRKSRRRRTLIDQVRQELERHGVKVYMADGEENPFIFGEERTEYLNRAKITLNITRTWYDDNFSRFALAAPNRSLIVSESMLRHCPAYEAGVHYVECAPAELGRTIVYYLQHPEERARIVENAYRLSTTRLTFHNSIRLIMDEVERVRQTRGLP